MKNPQKPTVERDAVLESLRRAHAQLKMLVLFGVNKDSKFLSLTFAEPCFVRDHVRRGLDHMCRRYARMMGCPLPYLSVLELHPGGHGYHVHMLINSPWVSQKDWQDDLWKLGIVNIKALDSDGGPLDLGRVSHYLAKYVEKDALNVPLGSRRYNVSKAWPKVPELEYLDFDTPEEAFAWVGSRSKGEGCMYRIDTYEIPTGEVILTQTLARPLPKGAPERA